RTAPLRLSNAASSPRPQGLPRPLPSRALRDPCEHIFVTKRIAVVGAGAVGGYFGGMLARAEADVVLIGRQTLVDTVNERGLFLDTVHFQAPVPMRASTEMSACRDADLVLFCVKTRDTVSTARELTPYLGPNTTIVSLQNGVENVDQIRATAGVDP